MNEIDVQFSLPFLRRLKDLAKRYRQIQKDLQPVIDELTAGSFPGDQIQRTGYTILKVRAKNSDIPTGKSGGYRLIYQVISSRSVSLLLVYAKSEQADVSVQEIVAAIEKGLKE